MRAFICCRLCPGRCLAYVSVHFPVVHSSLEGTTQGIWKHAERSKTWRDGGVADGLFPILHIWCEHDRSPPCRLKSQDPETLYHSVPLLECTFAEMPWSKTSIDTHLLYCHQTLVGLEELHRAKLLHGSISPQELWLLSDSHARENDNSVDVATITETCDLPMRAVLAGWVLGARGLKQETTSGMAKGPAEVRVSAESGASAKADVLSVGISWMSIFGKVDGSSDLESLHSTLMRTGWSERRRPSRYFAINAASGCYQSAECPRASEAQNLELFGGERQRTLA